MFLSAFYRSTFFLDEYDDCCSSPSIRPDLSVTIQFLSECHLIELIQYGLVEAFADTICLWRHRFSFSAVDIIDG